jgi:hypothetical protein
MGALIIFSMVMVTFSFCILLVFTLFTVEWSAAIKAIYLIPFAHLHICKFSHYTCIFRIIVENLNQEMANPGHSVPTDLRHKRWVKSTHWIITMSFIALAFSGFVILMAHPRLYWGDVGNDLTPALVDLPISRNYKHGGWEGQAAFFTGKNSPVTANRTYDIFNQNGWGRSLHFLSAWFLVVVGLIYLVSGIFTGHIRSNLLLRSRELSAKMFSADINSHLRMKIPKSTGGPQYEFCRKLRTSSLYSSCCL